MNPEIAAFLSSSLGILAGFLTGCMPMRESYTKFLVVLALAMFFASGLLLRYAIGKPLTFWW